MQNMLTVIANVFKGGAKINVGIISLCLRICLLLKRQRHWKIQALFSLGALKDLQEAKLDLSSLIDLVDGLQ